MKGTKKVRIVDAIYVNQLEAAVNAVLVEEEANGWHCKYIKPSPDFDLVFIMFTHAPWPKEEADVE